MPRITLPRIIGHRGAAAAAPENTLEAMRAAARQGVRGVEFDAKLTADGVAILMHDDTLERTTNGRGPVAVASAAAIARLDAGSWFGQDWRNVRVPTLAETLALLAELDVWPNIEIKPCPGRAAETARAVVAVVVQAWPTARPAPLLSSFERDSLAAAREAAPALPRGLLLEGIPADWRAQATALDCASVHCDAESLTSDAAAAIRAAGFGLAVYTVNEPAAARRLFAWGVDAVITDRPGALLEAS